MYVNFDWEVYVLYKVTTPMVDYVSVVEHFSEKRKKIRFLEVVNYWYMVNHWCIALILVMLMSRICWTINC